MDKALDKVPTARLLSLCLKLQNYTFKINHVPGAKVILANLLSRQPYLRNREENDEAEDLCCNAISAGCSSIALAHGEENETDIQMKELTQAAENCEEYQHNIKSFNMYKDRNDMSRKAKQELW